MTGKEYNEQFSKEELETEIWKDIPNFEGYYQISNLGRVKSLAREQRNSKAIFYSRERILKANKDKYGRFVVNLTRNCKGNGKKISSLVLESFVSLRPKNMECCHNDGNTLNNRLDNLRWDTHKNNIADKIKHNTILKGEKNPTAKLTEIDVHEIRFIYDNYMLSEKEIGEIFEVSQQTISDIINKFNWSGLDQKNKVILREKTINLVSIFINKETSIYRGVYINKFGCISSSIWCNNTKYYLGSFKTPEEAAEAYNQKALELFGKNARINKIRILV